MTITFELPQDIRFTEELGLNLVFQEVKVRGSKEVDYQVFVTEEGRDGFEVNQTYSFNSWEDMQEQFPTLKEFLEELSYNQHWSAEWRDNDRIFFIQSLTGHEGLYDVTETVWFDAQEQNEEEVES